jgi:hypothetical protein
MTQSLYKFILLFLISLCLSCNYAPIAPMWEIPDPYLNEVAMIRSDPNWGVVVIYNPDTCEEMGEACGFFRLQAFSHFHLNHSILAEPDDYPASLVKEADCWTAKYGKASEVQAMIKLLTDKNRNTAWKIHGNLEDRAETIKTCAAEAGKFTE